MLVMNTQRTTKRTHYNTWNWNLFLNHGTFGLADIYILRVLTCFLFFMVRIELLNLILQKEKLI
jgi:hypothetical protein